MPSRLQVRLCGLLLLLTVALTGQVGSAPPTAAHPFGDPQQVRLSLVDDEAGVVRATWSAAPDDYTALAIATGVVRGPRRMVFKDGATVPEQVDSGDADALVESGALADYLLARLALRQDGQECAAALLPVDDLTADGAVVEFRCPHEVEEVELEVQTLTDLHAAYRTLARTADGDSAVLTLDDSTHTFTFGEGGGSGLAHEGRRLVAITGVGSLAAIGVLLGVRRVRAARQRARHG